MPDTTRKIVLFEICHQIPGRMRLRVPILLKEPALALRLEETLRRLDGVQTVRCNPACASLTFHHRVSQAPSTDDLTRLLQPLIAPTRHRPQMTRRAPLSRSPERHPVTVKSSRTGSGGCLLCQMKLSAARWILADIWRCWQHNLTQRMRNLLVTAGIA